MPNGSARVRLTVPRDAVVTIDGKVVEGSAAERVYVTSELKDITNLEFKVAFQEDGNAKEHVLRTVVKRGDKKQLLCLNAAKQKDGSQLLIFK